MIINNIDFDIKEITVAASINYYNRYNYPLDNDIKIIATTNDKNLFALDKWLNQAPYRSNASHYKFDIVYNSIQIYGVFITDYTFDQYGINVTFAADYICGDLQLFNKQKLRKQKLEKIEKYVNIK
jgi:hypothetical protein